MLKKYNDFINEKYQIQQSDAPEIASDMNSYNDLEQSIRDFEKYKVDINNIYMTYKDETDLMNKLSAREFVNKKTQNKKEIEFKSPILALWAQCCEKRRQLKDMEGSISGMEDTIKTEQGNINNNSNNQIIQTNANSNIDQLKQNITDKKKEVESLKRDIMNKEKNANDMLKKMKDELGISKKRIDLYKTQKTVNSINTNEN